jgi:hypothetical protein
MEKIIMNKNLNNSSEHINLDKFTVHQGEFVKITPELIKDKKFISYKPFIEDKAEEENT